MNKILNRYIAKTIINATAMTTLIISAVLFVIMMLTELKDIGEGDYGIYEAFIFVLLRMPNELYQFSPLLILLGSIVGLSILSSHRELAVMRTSGFSIKNIIISVLSAAFLLMLVVGFVGEWIAPNLSFRAEIRKENEKNNGQAVVTTAGVWLHVENDFIHVKQIVDRQLFEGVTRYEFSVDGKLKAAYYAKTLTYRNNRWQMNNVVKTTFFPDKVRSESLQKIAWNLNFNPNLLTVNLVNPNEMSIPKLLRLATYLKQNNLQATEYNYEFWNRVFRPLASLVMIFLAIPFVLGTLSASTTGWRIMVGVMTGFAFFISNAFLGQLSVVYQLPPIFAASMPLLAFTLLGLGLCKQLIRR